MGLGTQVKKLIISNFSLQAWNPGVKAMAAFLRRSLRFLHLISTPDSSSIMKMLNVFGTGGLGETLRLKECTLGPNVTTLVLVGVN